MGLIPPIHPASGGSAARGNRGFLRLSEDRRIWEANHDPST